MPDLIGPVRGSLPATGKMVGEDPEEKLIQHTPVAWSLILEAWNLSPSMTANMGLFEKFPPSVN